MLVCRPSANRDLGVNVDGLARLRQFHDRMNKALLLRGEGDVEFLRIRIRHPGGGPARAGIRLVRCGGDVVRGRIIHEQCKRCAAGSEILYFHPDLLVRDIGYGIMDDLDGCRDSRTRGLVPPDDFGRIEGLMIPFRVSTGNHLP